MKRSTFRLLSIVITLSFLCVQLDAQSSDLMRRMYRHHEEVKEAGLDERRFKQSDILARINALSTDPAFGVSTAGYSVMGREIKAVSWGTGPTTVLL
ncbi:MAG: hypothetical protein K9I85_07065 [Saprospiraceae bacterium]|nr:hypothetical protein [Saprospiraceae bacterium]